MRTEKVRILWVGAHPDDELFVAAWFGKLMLERGASFHFLIATSGEHGPGFLENTDPLEVGSIREREMLASAALFDGACTFLHLPDAGAKEPEQVLQVWATVCGGSRALKERFKTAIDEARPDMIVTFDRYHGCTWHADHRAVGTLVQSLLLPVPTTLIESRTDFRTPVRFTAGDRRAIRVDVSATWDYLAKVMECHRTQFSAEIVTAVRMADEKERVVWLRHTEGWNSWDLHLDDARRTWFLLKAWVRGRLQGLRGDPQRND